MTGHSYRRRSIVGAAFALLAVPMAIRSGLAAQSFPKVQAYRNPGCGCCEKWSEHMKAAGFEIAMQDDPDLAARKAQLGISDKIAGCHTALVGDYVIEGHVPPEVIIRLLGEKSDLLGLAVPGMPMGSPGMETGDVAGNYDVLAINTDGTWHVYANH